MIVASLNVRADDRYKILSHKGYNNSCVSVWKQYDGSGPSFFTGQGLTLVKASRYALKDGTVLSLTGCEFGNENSQDILIPCLFSDTPYVWVDQLGVPHYIVGCKHPGFSEYFNRIILKGSPRVLESPVARAPERECEPPPPPAPPRPHYVERVVREEYPVERVVEREYIPVQQEEGCESSSGFFGSIASLFTGGRSERSYNRRSYGSERHYQSNGRGHTQQGCVPGVTHSFNRGNSGGSCIPGVSHYFNPGSSGRGYSGGSSSGRSGISFGGGSRSFGGGRGSSSGGGGGHHGGRGGR